MIHSARRRLRGISIIEVLLALAIASTLLVAVVYSIRSTLVSVRGNETYARLALKGRNTMMRMVEQTRRSAAHDPHTVTDPRYPDSGTVDDIGLTMMDRVVDGSGAVQDTLYDYYWDQTSGNLYVKVGANSAVVLLSGVTNFKVTLWGGKSNPNLPHNDILLRATFFMTIKDTETTSSTPDTMTFSNSAVPRVNVWMANKLVGDISAYLGQ